MLLGLNNAPQIVYSDFISVADVDFLVMPYNSLGSTPVFEALKRNIPIYAVRENKTLLNVKNSNLFKSNRIIEVESYKDCLKLIQEAL